jgi:DNA-binding PadR family transcriptional regulator
MTDSVAIAGDERGGGAWINLAGPERRWIGGEANFAQSSILDRLAEAAAGRQDEGWIPPMEHQDLLSGLVRLHVLHHAAEGEVYGQWMIEELARHGYKLSPGTLYPMLHAMERRGYLTSASHRFGKTFRRVYRATPLGREALAVAAERARELFHEMTRGD